MKLIKKTFLLFLIFFLVDSIVYAKSGVGELKLSEQTLRHFHKHITSKKGKPYIFLVTEDGQGSSSWYCPYAQCAPTGASNERGKCERRYGKKCFVFALGYSVKWKNNFTKEAKAKEKRFRSKDSLEDMRYKLKSLGFLEGISSEVPIDVPGGVTSYASLRISSGEYMPIASVVT